MNTITSIIPIKPAINVFKSTLFPYDALTFWLDISVNFVVIDPALILSVNLSASSLVKLPVIITSDEKPCDTVAADKHTLSSLPHVSLSFE